MPRFLCLEVLFFDDSLLTPPALTHNVPAREKELSQMRDLVVIVGERCMGR
mgnify:CR=1 FL=1